MSNLASGLDAKHCPYHNVAPPPPRPPQVWHFPVGVDKIISWSLDFLSFSNVFHPPLIHSVCHSCWVICSRRNFTCLVAACVCYYWEGWDLNHCSGPKGILANFLSSGSPQISPLHFSVALIAWEGLLLLQGGGGGQEAAAGWEMGPKLRVCLRKNPSILHQETGVFASPSDL